MTKAQNNIPKTLHFNKSYKLIQTITKQYKILINNNKMTLVVKEQYQPFEIISESLIYLAQVLNKK